MSHRHVQQPEKRTIKQHRNEINNSIRKALRRGGSKNAVSFSWRTETENAMEGGQDGQHGRRG